VANYRSRRRKQPAGCAARRPTIRRCREHCRIT